MQFSNPLALILLLSLPILVLLGPSLRGAFKRREILSVGLRAVVMTGLILSLAGLELIKSSNRLAVMFLLDSSDSISTSTKSQAEAFIRASLDQMGPEDQAGVIVFGKQAVVERSLTSSHNLGMIHSVPERDQTNFEEAIRLALALMPPDAAGRIVLLSDGIETSGDAEIAARLAAASGVQIVTVPLRSGLSTEALIQKVEAPAHLREGEQYDLQVTIEASQPTQSQVRVFANGQLLYQGTQQLERGQHRYSLPLQASQSLANSGRFTRFQVQIEPQNDSYYQNNKEAAFSQIEGPPRLLLIAPPPGEPLPYRGSSGPSIRQDEAAQLIQALNSSGYRVDVARPSGLPGELSDLADYDAVVLVDVPASELTSRQMTSLQSYVRDLGGGLLAVGGPTSFGVGGYYRTPLEETLPLEMQMKDQLRRPNLTMLFIIDHSGSMGETSGGVSKLDLAKEAAMRSIELLNPTDRAGVIAFDDSATWVVPITDVSHPENIINRIGTLREGGGTDILAGLQAMAQVLQGDPSSVKHVILLTDGGANPAGIPELVTRLNQQDGITFTTVGVGRDAAPYLANLAELGGGRYHFAADPGAIPRIFTEETSLASHSYMIERSFVPIQTSSSSILSGLDDSIPALNGYIGTTARPVAQTILVSDLNDPILAAWQYGLGRAIAFTSDATGRWASEWLNWPGFPKIWAQTIQDLLPDVRKSVLILQVVQDEELANLIVEAQDENGGFLNGYQLHANIASPNGEIAQMDLVQSAPGQYEGKFSPQAEGAYLISVTGHPGSDQDTGISVGQEPDSWSVAETAGWIRAYSPEYRQINRDGSQTLSQLANLTHGWVATGLSADGIFTHNLPSGVNFHPLWPWLLAMVAVLLPLDIAVRRLALTPEELQHLFVILAQRLAARPAQRDANEPTQRPASLSAFVRAKQRAENQSLSSIEKTGGGRKDTPAQRDDILSEIAPDPVQKDFSYGKPEQAAKPANNNESTTAANLLAAKRKRNRKQ